MDKKGTHFAGFGGHNRVGNLKFDHNLRLSEAQQRSFLGARATSIFLGQLGLHVTPVRMTNQGFSKDPLMMYLRTSTTVLQPFCPARRHRHRPDISCHSCTEYRSTSHRNQSQAFFAHARVKRIESRTLVLYTAAQECLYFPPKCRVESNNFEAPQQYRAREAGGFFIF